MNPRAGAWISLVAGMVLLFRATGTPVQLWLDGRSLAVRTHATNVAGVLREIGGPPGPQDRISPSPESVVRPNMSITWWRSASVWIQSGESLGNWVQSSAAAPADILLDTGQAVFSRDRIWADGIPALTSSFEGIQTPSRLGVSPRRAFSVDLGGRMEEVESAAPSMGEALWDQGIRLREADAVSAPIDGPPAGPDELRVQFARPIRLHLAGGNQEIWSSAETVGGALQQAGLPLAGLDYSVPDAGRGLGDQTDIRVVRVREEVVSVLEPLPFDSDFEGDPELEIDLQRLISAGVPGVASTSTRVRYEDGVEVSRMEEARRVARPAETRVIGYGTKTSLHSLDTPDGTITYWRAVSMYATAYSPCHSAADRCYPNTSSGKPVQKGVVAFVLRWYRVMRGLPVYIPGYGFATVEDVGGGIPGRFWIDLGYSDSDIVSWNRWVTVYFLAPVPSPDRIYWVLD